MAMRTLHQLRRLLNGLLREGSIDEDTVVVIETTRELNDKNTRIGIQNYQKKREEEREGYHEKLREWFSANTGEERTPTEDEVLKYQLWEEQQHICLYTGRTISLSDIYGGQPNVDIEHTIPRSRGLDNSQANKTLCDAKFNRDIKGNKIPTELAEYEEIRMRLRPWEERLERLKASTEKIQASARMTVEKESKDKKRQKYHESRLERDYWQEKMRRFTLEDVTTGFKNSQIVDTGIISKIARAYLKTVFPKVETVKGRITADFRKHWGLEEEKERKKRNHHIHHTIDAVVIACLNRNSYDRLASYYRNHEKYIREHGERPRFKKPWESFTEDVIAMAENTIIVHYTPNTIFHTTKYKLRRYGRIVRGNDDQPMFITGRGVRGVLHEETYYGAVLTKTEGGEEIRHAVRKKLGELEGSEIKQIIDPQIRRIVEANSTLLKEGELKLPVKSLLLKDGTKKSLRSFHSKEEVEEQVKSYHLKERFLELVKERGLFQAREEGLFVPIKSVRIFTAKKIKPMALKGHRDLSEKEYKRQFWVKNKSNYLMGLYEGEKKGRVKKGFKLVPLIEAAIKKRTGEGVLPKDYTEGGVTYTLEQVLRIGQTVLLFEDSPGKIDFSDAPSLLRRMYKVTELSINPSGPGYGKITLLHVSEARPKKDLKQFNGPFKYEEGIKGKRMLLHTQFRGLVEGRDFRVTPQGCLIPKSP